MPIAASQYRCGHEAHGRGRGKVFCILLIDEVKLQPVHILAI